MHYTKLALYIFGIAIIYLLFPFLFGLILNDDKIAIEYSYKSFITLTLVYLPIFFFFTKKKFSVSLSIWVIIYFIVGLLPFMIGRIFPQPYLLFRLSTFLVLGAVTIKSVLQGQYLFKK